MDKPNGGKTLPQLAARYGYVEVVCCLLAAKAYVDEPNGGKTPLQLAARNGHVEVMCCLLAAKADVDKADKLGWTA